MTFEEIFDTFIHENLHAADYAASEEWVDETATDLCKNILRYFKVELRQP